MPYTVAVTGGVASGKSAVTRRFEALGITVHDADLVAREVVAPGTEGLAAITAHFGPEVLAPDGSLDRPAMRQRIFADPTARHALEAIIHPRVRTLLRTRATAHDNVANPVGAHHMRDGDHAASPATPADDAVAHAMRSYSEPGSTAQAGYVIVAVPLLAESSGDWSWINRILVVDVPAATQLQRLMARDGTDAAAAEAMLAAQASRAERLAIADDVIVNDGPLVALDRAVATMHGHYASLARALAPHGIGSSTP